MGCGGGKTTRVDPDPHLSTDPRSVISVLPEAHRGLHHTHGSHDYIVLSSKSRPLSV